MRIGKRIVLTPEQVDEVDTFWRTLAESERIALERDEGRPPRRLVARFVEPDEDVDGMHDFYEYLVNHEIYLGDPKVFHICTAHPEARAAVATGCIPTTFRCPLENRACPMRALLAEAPGRDVHLRGAR